MLGDVVHVLNQRFEHWPVPAGLTATASDQLNTWVHRLHDFREFDRGFAILPKVLAADLPVAEDFVTQSPEFHSVRFRMTALAAQIGKSGTAFIIAILYPACRLIQGSRAHVDADIWLRTELSAGRDKFVRAETIRFALEPGEIEAC